MLSTTLFYYREERSHTLYMRSKSSWKNIKPNIQKLTHAELMGLISDLYALDARNSRFLNARFSHAEESLSPFKEIIRETVFPKLENNEDLHLSEGRKAIRDYRKSGGNLKNVLELMVYFIECGNNFTLSYGDIDEKFYNSIISMFTDVLETLKTAEGKAFIPLFLPRLQSVVRKADGIGWGYYDDMSSLLKSFIKNGYLP